MRAHINSRISLMAAMAVALMSVPARMLTAMPSIGISSVRPSLVPHHGKKRRKARCNNAPGHFKRKPGSGIQECARRVRQIRCGQLTASNGLVQPNV